MINIKVHPNSSKEEIKKLEDSSYEIWLKEKAIDGKANNALVKILSKEFNVNGKDIKVKGLRSRKKRVEINDYKK